MKIEVYRDADYREILELQRRRFGRMVDRRRNNLPVEEEWLMAVEHRPVYTLGRHGHPANLLNPEFLSSEGIDLVEIERGGDITFHGPGQVVVYPLIDLAKRGLGVKAYVNLLEEAVIRTVAEWGIEATRQPDAPGVWVGNRKICALGIKCSRFIAMHGLALNATTDLRYFSAINPCGFTDRPATSLRQLLSEGETLGARQALGAPQTLGTPQALGLNARGTQPSHSLDRRPRGRLSVSSPASLDRRPGGRLSVSSPASLPPAGGRLSVSKHASLDRRPRGRLSVNGGLSGGDGSDGGRGCDGGTGCDGEGWVPRACSPRCSWELVAGRLIHHLGELLTEK